MRTPKPYTARSIEGAQRRVRELVKLNASLTTLLERYAKERTSLAKLCAGRSTFCSSIDFSHALRTCEQILAELGYNPDGSPKDVHR